MADLDKLARRRVKIRLDTVGCADEAAAVEDAARIAAFVAMPAASTSHAAEQWARLDDVDPAPDASPPAAQRPATTVHEVLLLIALLVGLGATALTLPGVSTGRAALRLDPGLLLSGILAVVCVGLYLGLEPYRRSSRMMSLRVATSGIILFQAVCWAAVCVISAFVWNEVPSFSVAAPLGIAVLLIAIAGAIALWVRARRTDRRIAAQTQRRRRLDATGQQRYLAAMDRWWAEFGATLSTDRMDVAQRAYRSALAQLRQNGFLSTIAETAAAARPVSSVWREERL